MACSWPYAHALEDLKHEHKSEMRSKALMPEIVYSPFHPTAMHWRFGSVMKDFLA